MSLDPQTLVCSETGAPREGEDESWIARIEDGMNFITPCTPKHNIKYRLHHY